VRFLGQTGTVATTGARTTEWLGIGKAGSLRADPESRLFIARTGEVIGFPWPKLDRPDRRTPYCRADAPAPIVIPKNRNSVPAHPPYGPPDTHHNPLSFRGTRNHSQRTDRTITPATMPTSPFRHSDEGRIPRRSRYWRGPHTACGGDGSTPQWGAQRGRCHGRSAVMDFRASASLPTLLSQWEGVRGWDLVPRNDELERGIAAGEIARQPE
jgi:hypothetical protein